MIFFGLDAYATVAAYLHGLNIITNEFIDLYYGVEDSFDTTKLKATIGFTLSANAGLRASVDGTSTQLTTNGKAIIAADGMDHPVNRDVSIVSPN